MIAGTPVSTVTVWTADSTCGAGLVPVAATDGYIDLKVKDEANAQINKLYNNSAGETALVPGPFSVLKNFVDTQPFFWGSSSTSAVALNTDNQPINGNYVWNTGALDAFNQYSYRLAPTPSVLSPSSTR